MHDGLSISEASVVDGELICSCRCPGPSDSPSGTSISAAAGDDTSVSGDDPGTPHDHCPSRPTPRVMAWSIVPPQLVCMHRLQVGPPRSTNTIRDIIEPLQDVLQPLPVAHQLQRQAFLPARVAQPQLILHLKINQGRFESYCLFITTEIYSLVYLVTPPRYMSLHKCVYYFLWPFLLLSS